MTSGADIIILYSCVLINSVAENNSIVSTRQVINSFLRFRQVLLGKDFYYKTIFDYFT